VKRLPIVLLGVVAVVGLGLVSSIVTQGFRDLAEAEAERDQLQREKQELEQRIEQLEATLEALRSNPEAVESLARKELGWIRPGEVVVILATPTPPPDPESLTDPVPTPILALRD
jgi:cell division protein FtsB